MEKEETVGKTYTTKTSRQVVWSDSISNRIDNQLSNTTESILLVLKRRKTTIWVCSKTSTTEKIAVVSKEKSIKEIQTQIAG